MIRINLLPVRAAQKKEKLVSQLAAMVAVVVGTFAICGFVHFSLVGKIDDARQRNSRTQAKINGLAHKIREVSRFKDLQKELQGKLDVLSKLKAAKSGPVRLLDELNRAMPEKLWLEEFVETLGQVIIKGVGLNEEAVAAFMEKLESSASYQDVELNVIEQRERDGNKIQQFELKTRAAVSPAVPDSKDKGK